MTATWHTRWGSVKRLGVRVNHAKEGGSNKTASLSGKNDVVCFYFTTVYTIKWIVYEIRWARGGEKWRESIGGETRALAICLRESEVRFWNFFFDRFDFRLVLTLFPSDFTLAVVEDLGNGRSPVLSIDRFSNYCSKSNDSWFDFFFPFRLNVISVSLAL